MCFTEQELSILELVDKEIEEQFTLTLDEFLTQNIFDKEVLSERVGYSVRDFSWDEQDGILYNRLWYEANKEKKKAMVKRWSAANKEKRKEYRKKYYENNREKVNAQKRKYASENKEKIAESKRRSRERFKEKHGVSYNTWYARKKKQKYDNEDCSV